MADFTEYTTIQGTDLDIVRNEMNVKSKEAFNLVSFIPIIKSTDEIFYTVLMSKLNTEEV